VEGAVTPYAVAVNYGQPLIRLALSALVVMAGGGVISILWVNALTSLVTLGALVFMDPSLSVSAGRVADLWSKVWHILSESMWMAMLLLVGQAMRFVDVVLLAALSSVKVAGEYTAMSNVAQLILIYPGAISQTLGPEIARLHQSGDRAGMVSALEDYLRKASLLGGYLFGGIAVFGSQLDLVFGAQFTFSWQLAVLLAFGWFVSATLGPVSFALSMTGRHKQDFIILVIGSLVLIVSLGLTIPGLQEVGAAFSVALAFVVVNAIRAIIVGRSLRFNPVKLRDILPPLYFALIAMACAQFGLKAAERGFLNLLCQCIIYSLLSFALYMFVFAKPGESRYVINRLTL
jgi:O-antigen/teichoic acid export membrane protein